MKLDIYKTSGEKSSKKATLKKEVFGIKPNDHSIYLSVFFSLVVPSNQGKHTFFSLRG